MYPILETERLMLKPLQDSDFEDMLGLFSNTAVTATMEGLEGKTPKLAAFQKWFSDVSSIDSFFTIRCKETEGFFGYCQIHPIIKQNKVSFSQMNIALLPEYWGQGYATETTHKLLNFAFIGVSTRGFVQINSRKTLLPEAFLKNAVCAFSKPLRCKTDYITNIDIKLMSI